MRLRATRHLRDLCAETEFNRAQLIQPLFVVEGLAGDEAIPGLRGTLRQNIESMLHQVESDLAAGVTQFLLFASPAGSGLARASDSLSQVVAVSRWVIAASLASWALR